MAIQPFTWSGNQAITSPEQAARKRAVAEALIGQSATPGRNWAEGLSDVAAALSGTVLGNRVDEAEAAGRERAGGLFADLAVNQDPNAIIAALTSPDAQWASPTQTSIASALLNSGLERQDPMYQLQKQKLEAEIGMMGQPKPVDPTAGMQNYEYLVSQGVDPTQAQGMAFGGGGTVVNNNLGQTDKFRETLDTESAKTFNMLMDAGNAAQVSGVKLGQLEALLQSAPQGASGALTSMAASLGLPVEGGNEVQAAEALINQLVPAQRPVGSGTMSDADLALFKASLPRIINQPGGNQMIINTMKAINDYTVQQGQIATAVATGQMTPDQGRQALYSIPNPLAPAQAAPAAPSPVEGWQDLGNGVRVRPMGQ